MGLIKSSVHWVLQTFSLVKWTEREIEHLFQSSAEGTNSSSVLYTYSPGVVLRRRGRLSEYVAVNVSWTLDDMSG